MGLLNFLPGVGPLRLAMDLAGLIAILYAGYDLIYKPIEKHGYERGIAVQTALMNEAMAAEQKKTKAVTDALEKARKDNDDALKNVADIARQQVEVIQQEKVAAERKAANALADYKKAREQAIQAVIKATGSYNGPVDGKPYFAPIEIAGLSRQGVDAINVILGPNK